MNKVRWFKDAIIYQILIDRFAGFTSFKNWDKPIFLGGTIKGIIKKIGYLKELGINTIWISPFYKTSAYHGYHITDYYQVDPHFGTKKDFKNLVKKVHSNNMRIIADFVPNHCSKEHLFFKEAQKNPNSKYRKWFYFTKWPYEYLSFLSVKDIPKINLNNQDARNYIIEAAKYWLNLGLDGYRLDHVIGPSHNFWKEFKKELKKEKSSFVLIGEAWMKGIKFYELKTINIKHKYLKWIFGASSDQLLREYINILDGVLDFRFQEIINNNILNINNKQSEREIQNKIIQHLKKYPEHYFLPTFLDNHDMNRFLYECANEQEKLKTAAKIQFSIDQPPIIYYGTETGMTQANSIWKIQKHGDLQTRQPMNWQKSDLKLLNYYRKIIQKRIHRK